MCFADKVAYLANKDNLEMGSKTNGLEFGDEFQDSERSKNAHIDLEFKLHKLVDFLKKQGYPIENSFVSYYSADFQVQINCGPEPISKVVALSMTDLEQNHLGEYQLKLIFSKGIKGDFYDTEVN